MLDYKKAKEIFEKIESDKEVLSVIPKNNKKNIDKYIETVEELEKEYKNYENEILEILTDRYQKAISIEINPEIGVLEGRLETIEKILHIIDEYKTPYEKMGLDKVIYKLGKFYKDNLENVNQQIFMAIQKFSEVGINLTNEEFNYSKYVKEYMDTFFIEMKKGDINSSVIKEKFEEIYWKCSDIIIHIELNFKYLYMKYETVIDKYFVKEKNVLLKKWKKSIYDIKKIYAELKTKKTNLEQLDKKILLTRFLEGELHTKDFSSAKLKENYDKMIVGDVKENIDEISINVEKFLNSLNEYKNYIEFKFFIDDVKQYYSKKEEYKRSYEDIKKDIQKDEIKLKKLNKKIDKKTIFGKSKEKNQKILQNQIILELQTKYKELEKNKFYYQIYLKLNDDTSLCDILELVNSYYIYMIDCMVRNSKTITQEEMDEKIEKLDEFLKSPYKTLICNISILEEKDIAMVIKDRYKLLNFNIEKEDISDDNIDNLIKTFENIKIGLNLKQIGLDINTIEDLCSIKNILSK